MRPRLLHLGTLLTLAAAQLACADPAVAAFEGFYAAMAHADAHAFRRAVCPTSTALVDQLTSAQLTDELRVTRVARAVRVVKRDAQMAVVDVEDATGTHQQFTLLASVDAPHGYCVTLEHAP